MVKPTAAARGGKDVTHRENEKVEQKSQCGDKGITQEGHTLKGGMNDEHRIDVVCLFCGYECFKNKIAVKPDEEHSQNGDDHISHVAKEIGAKEAKNGNQQQIEKKRGVRDDALCHLKVGKGGVHDEIHIGKHANERGDDAEPKDVIGKKECDLAILVGEQTVDEGTPHHDVARIDR